MSPLLPPFASAEKILAYAERLRAAQRKRFFLLPVTHAADAAHWILASFFSPLVVVPYSGALPAAAVERLVRQLPEGESIALNELPDSGPKAALELGKPAGEIWAVIFSSGSSGDPKGVALSGAALRSSAEAHAAHSGLRGGSWLLNLPLYHVGGFSVITRALFNGSDVRFSAPKFSPEETIQEIQRGVNGLSLVPTTLQRVLAAAPTLVPPATLKMILLGGAGASPALVAESLQRHWPVHTTYGMTEHCSQIATESAPGAGLRALPGVELRVAEDGEILVRSACLASGYYVAGRFYELPRTDGFFAAGDLGAFTGDRLVILGRKSELIITGGLNVFPGEVENALARAPGVKDCGVAGVAHAEWGESVVAAVVAENEMVSERGLKEFLRGQIDGRIVPKRIVFVTTIPRTPLGKIIRPQLRELLAKKIYQDR